jgi:ATP-dependent Lhr-like helicase
MEGSSQRDPVHPIYWIANKTKLSVLCDALRAEAVIGLDVETAIHSRMLCLIQVAASSGTYLLDALMLPDLSPLANLFADPLIVKVIHNAAFERSVFGRRGLIIESVVDTLHVSRRLRGKRANGGHSLKVVCARELGVHLDKSEQVSDWSRRPLSEDQIAYAAFDAEVLLRLFEHFGRPVAGNSGERNRR